MQTLSKGVDHKEILEWLLFEVKSPCDLTFHTYKARNDLEDFLKFVEELIREKECH